MSSREVSWASPCRFCCTSFANRRDVAVKAAVFENGQLVPERDIEPELASESIATLHFYGSLFFASAQYFEEQLPHPTEETRNAVVILNLRGQRDLDTTTLDMLTDYAQELLEHDCRLMLADVGEAARETLERTGKLAVFGSDNVFAGSQHLQESVFKAYTEAERWLNTRP